MADAEHGTRQSGGKPSLTELIERSAELKGQLVAFGQRTRFGRRLTPLLLEAAGPERQLDEGEAIGSLVRRMRVESTSGLAGPWGTRAGSITPCWCTGTGRALLLDHTPDQIAALLDGYELIGVGGPNAARSADDLVKANDHDRTGGVIVAHGEFEHGVSEYAVPVRDRRARIRAAIALLGRQRDLAAHDMAIRADLMEAASSLAE
ncbi:IclR family transcriptional regulator C-terminal domain-containing protein [Streptomyces sp. NPDC013178]|uniref:IclR family transcriptional regulator domain-containing protein n=1 Tax=Streptomyces sp. NPDC013178 TaxID=3155118 RepID=UPI003407CE5A